MVDLSIEYPINISFDCFEQDAWIKNFVCDQQTSTCNLQNSILEIQSSQNLISDINKLALNLKNPTLKIESNNMDRFCNNSLLDKNTIDTLEKSIKIADVAKLTSSKKLRKKKSFNQSSSYIFNHLSKRWKRITKNYMKRCINFAIDELNNDLLIHYLTSEEVIRFRAYFQGKISTATTLMNFGELLLVLDNDNSEIRKFKELFQRTSEIFITNYAANWIFNSKNIKDVKGHLFARFKIFRRIQNPKNFTSN